MKSIREETCNNFRVMYYIQNAVVCSFIIIIALIFNLSFCSDVSAVNFHVDGFVQGNYAVNTVADNPDGKEFKWSEERVQIKLEASREQIRFVVKEDAFYNQNDSKTSTEMREGYIDYSASKWDIRAGKQIVTWGVGDFLFINDVFPKNYNAYYSGQALEYLKKGVDALKIGYYPEIFDLELVTVPVFEPNTLPDERQFWVYDPLSGVSNRETIEPPSILKNTEVALRLYRDIAGFDVSVYCYRGYYRQPSELPDNPIAPTKLLLFYPKLNVYGSSIQGKAMDGVVSFETGYYDSREDLAGNNSAIINSQSKYLIVYQRQLWEDCIIGLQYYAEYMHNYAAYERNLPLSAPKERQLHQLATVRMTQLVKNQTLKLSFFAIYGLSEGDYLINPEVKYNVTDLIWTSLGTMIFGGRSQWSQFGQLSKDDNVYALIRYEF